MDKEIWCASAPSFYGGADTELYHQIILWRKNNIDVNIVPNTIDSIDPKMLQKVINLGCKIHKYSPNVFKDKIVVSYCNGVALKRLEEIYKFPPRCFIWFNCMTWTFEDEIKGIENGWITHIGFISNYQKNILIEEYLKKISKEIPKDIEYYPFFDISGYDVFEKNNDYFGIGRISRDDPGKFSKDCWEIFDRVLSPMDKKVFILGYSSKIEEKIGKPPNGLDWMWWQGGSISSEEFYKKIDVMIHKTGGSRESYCRVFIEAMAHGIVPLVERNYAFPEILLESKDLDWLMCSSSDEMSYKASCLAFDNNKLIAFKNMCREYVEKYIINENKSIDCWLKLLNE